MAARLPSAMLSSSISSEVACAAMMFWRAAALMAMTLRMTGSHCPPLGGVSLGGLLVIEGFGTSARQRENGFIPRRIVSSQPRRRNIRTGNTSNFNERKIKGIPPEGAYSGLVGDRREQISAASDGADYRGFSRVRFDLAPDSHDSQIDGAIEGFAVTCVGQFQQALTRQHPLRIRREHLEQAEFGSSQRMLIALVVAQCLRLEIEPFGAEPHQLVLGRLGTSGFRRCRRCSARRAAP